MSVLAVMAPGAALAQSGAELLDTEGGRTPTVEPVPYEQPRVASVSRPTQTDRADLVHEGWLEMEFGWSQAFAERNLQVGTVQAKYAPLDILEVRLGWDIFGVLGPLDRDVAGLDESDAGVGDLFAAAKIGIPLDIDEPERHRLAVLTTLRPGIGQQPVTVDGLNLGAFAVYSTFPGPVEVDVQAGVQLRGIFETAYVDLPLSSAVRWRALPWLSAVGEVAETLTFEDLNESQTSLLVGALFHASDALVFDASTSLGLSESLPDAVLQLGLTWLAAPVSGPDS